MIDPPRRLVLVAGLALVAGEAIAAKARPRPPQPRDDLALGRPRAPVTVIEYASLGCPHCAAFAIEQFPKFKAAYIDTGKVRFVLREMLTGNPTLAEAGFLTARCAGPARYFQVVDGVYRAQAEMFGAGGAYAPLLKVAQAAGLTEDQLTACLKDQKGIDALQAREKRAESDGVDSTPTFFVAGAKFEGDHTFEALSAAVDKALRPHRARRS